MEPSDRLEEAVKLLREWLWVGEPLKPPARLIDETRAFLDDDALDGLIDP